MTWIFAAVFVIAGMAAYFPLIFIRKMNKVVAILERIEKNTSSASAAGAAAGK